MKNGFPHLLPAFAAILTLFGLLAGGSLYARSLELRYVNALAPARPRQANIGSALQEAALLQPDLLPVYGSSEMFFEKDENSAAQFFQNYPTGFTVFEVAVGGITSLEIAQNLAALGPELKGKKVIVSFTPHMFIKPQIGQTAYAGDFSRLHANEMVFDSSISFKLKQRTASRMLDYPDSLVNDPLLNFALQNLASRSPFHRLMYYLSMPVGWVQTQVIRLQDHWAVLNWIHSHAQTLRLVPRKTYSIDWNAEIDRARILQNELTSSNPYGIENSTWDGTGQQIPGREVAPGSSNNYFSQEVAHSKEWDDLDILLSVLKETGARPLILSRPLNGVMWNVRGVSSAARRAFYKRLQEAVQPYGFPLVDFSDQDTNRLFSTDFLSHTSRLEWVYIDQTLDAFYHGKIH
ncbi:MAG: D-alanyl-lipoteichoic acid biosynthesis protein DltD [Anaerolineaceae bacterium]|jgi:D-alanine transfer protein